MLLDVTKHFKFVNVWTFLASFCVCLASENVTTLDVSLYEVTQDSVEIDWHFTRNVNNWGVKSLKKCKLVYGPQNHPEQLEVLSNFLPDSYSFKVTELTVNVTYHFHMVCHTTSGHRLESNVLHFTPGENVVSNSDHFISSDSYKASYDAVSHGSLYSEDDTLGSYARTVQSSSVILGAVCGIVGFLIINITVVMAVRKYSHRQMRRRRILEIEDNDYNEFPYLQGYE